jgi:peptidoglycan hydrolase CwlO-like protein
MADSDLTKVIEELRAQQAGFEAKLADLETRHGKNQGDIKNLADTKAELIAAVDGLRAEIANKEAALAAVRGAAKKSGITGIEDIDAILEDNK